MLENLLLVDKKKKKKKLIPTVYTEKIKLAFKVSNPSPNSN